MKPIRTYEITVPDFPPVKYVGRSPAKAMARCWRDYGVVDDRCTFKEFLKMARLHVVSNDPGTGNRILVGGLEATRVIVPQQGHYIAFMRDDSDDILFSHPMDVQSLPLAA